jgi:mannose/fructose/N-acetylgalactosamine-specific phosphotransferase system component IIC
MEKKEKQLFAIVIKMIWNTIITVAFGVGFILTLLTLLPDSNQLSQYAFYAALTAQSYLFVNFGYIALLSYNSFKKETNKQKKIKLDAEITKRAAELIKEKEENQVEKL